MKLHYYIFLAIIGTTVGCSSDNDSEPAAQEPIETVIYLIRHAEKADTSANSDLSAIGFQRADNWLSILQEVNFEAFYSTNYNRTLHTAQPLATHNGKEIALYDPAHLSLQNVIADHSGKTVFIVGHSNTIPQLINSYLGAETYPDMTETEFGNLYKISITGHVITHELTVHN